MFFFTLSVEVFYEIRGPVPKNLPAAREAPGGPQFPPLPPAAQRAPFTSRAPGG
jgi:hypothetical protein